MCILNCYQGPDVSVGLDWGTSAAQQGLLLSLHSGINHRTFSWKKCTVLYWYVWGKNFLPRDQYSCQDMYKQIAVLALGWQMIDNGHPPLTSQLSLRSLFVFPGLYYAFCLFPSFSSFLSASVSSFLYFFPHLFRNMFINPTFGLPLIQHCLSPLASSASPFTEHVGDKAGCLSSLGFVSVWTLVPQCMWVGGNRTQLCASKWLAGVYTTWPWWEAGLC